MRGPTGLRLKVATNANPNVEGDMVSDHWQDDKPRDECGVFGIFGPGLDVSRIAYFGLHALQHRGQESAGIAVSGDEGMRIRKRLGLVQTVFDESDLRHLQGDIAVGHARYSTTGSTRPENAGPMSADSPLGQIVVAHNGNIVNAAALRTELEDQGIRFTTTTDTEVLTKLIASSPGDSVPDMIKSAMPRCTGAFSLCVLTETSIIGVRDLNGIRPLVLGSLDGGQVIASESCALSTVGASLLRDIEPGEIVVVDDTGVSSDSLAGSSSQAMCLFEYIYFARPDSLMAGKRVYLARRRMGEALAREAPAAADVVIPLPDSAIPAAIGFAEESGIPYSEGLIKNRYIGRTFIQPDQKLREIGVRLKFSALPEIVRGKRVVLVDDSIVRATTSRLIVELLRSAGAREVHMRIHSPPIKHPCYLGVDMARREELIAAQSSVAEIEAEIGADSLRYLSLDALIAAVGHDSDAYCVGCLHWQLPGGRGTRIWQIRP